MYKGWTFISPESQKERKKRTDKLFGNLFAENFPNLTEDV